MGRHRYSMCMVVNSGRTSRQSFPATCRMIDRLSSFLNCKIAPIKRSQHRPRYLISILSQIKELRQKHPNVEHDRTLSTNIKVSRLPSSSNGCIPCPSICESRQIPYSWLSPSLSESSCRFASTRSPRCPPLLPQF